MNIIRIILLTAGLVCFLLATFNVGGRLNLVALGLACWILTQLLPAIT